MERGLRRKQCLGSFLALVGLLRPPAAREPKIDPQMAPKSNPKTTPRGPQMAKPPGTTNPVKCSGKLILETYQDRPCRFRNTSSPRTLLSCYGLGRGRGRQIRTKTVWSPPNQNLSKLWGYAFWLRSWPPDRAKAVWSPRKCPKSMLF